MLERTAPGPGRAWNSPAEPARTGCRGAAVRRPILRERTGSSAHAGDRGSHPSFSTGDQQGAVPGISFAAAAPFRAHLHGRGVGPPRLAPSGAVALGHYD